MTTILKANDVTKSYGDYTALKNFSIEINSGDIVALLGPNGAGKTTFVKSLLGLVSIDSGSINLYDLPINDSRSRRKIAYLPEKFSFYSYFTVLDTLKFYSSMYNADSTKTDYKYFLEMLSIEDLINKKLKTLSKGQLQRLGIACSLIGDQDFIILDEPFSGLDPIGIKDVKDICMKLKAENKTVLINSHILAEMEKIADKVIILNKGIVQKSGLMTEITKDEALEDVFYGLIKGPVRTEGES